MLLWLATAGDNYCSLHALLVACLLVDGGVPYRPRFLCKTINRDPNLHEDLSSCHTM